MIVREIFDKRVPPYIALSLDFEGTDAEFVQTNKNMAIEIIGEVIGEIEDGFIDGMNDVLPFIKENMKTMITEACDPKNAALAVMMALPPIMNFVERANETYKKQKEEAKQNASQPKQADRQDVQMEEESKEPRPKNNQPLSQQLATANSPQERRQILMNRYQETLVADQAIIAARIQRPLSRAYQSLDLNTTRELIEDEQKKTTKEYERTKSEKAKTKPEFFKALMRESLIDTQRFKSAIVDSELKKVDAEIDIPAELQQAYYDMFRAGVKARLCSDKDYQKLKGTNRFEYLDQL